MSLCVHPARAFTQTLQSLTPRKRVVQTLQPCISRNKNQTHLAVLRKAGALHITASPSGHLADLLLACMLACSLAPLNRIELGLGYPTQACCRTCISRSPMTRACSLMVGSRVDGSNVVVAMHNYRGCACNVGHGNGNAQPSWMVGSKEGVWWWR